MELEPNLSTATESFSEGEIAECYNVSAESRFNQIINGGVTTAFVCFGFVINIFVIVILRSLRKRSIQNYLIALAVWENLLLLSAFFLYSLSTLLYSKRTIDGNYVHIYPIAYTTSNVSLMGTLWMIVALTVDRYRFIVDPIRFRVNPLESGHSRCTFILILVLSLFALSLGIPLLFEMTLTHCIKPDGRIVPMIVLTNLRNNRIYKIGYRVIGGLMFQSLVPVTLLAYLMGRISMELYRARLRRRKMSSPAVTPRSPSRPGASPDKLKKVRKRIENSDNLMLLCVVFKFLLTRSLPLALDVTETVLEEQFNRIPFIALLVNISNVLVVVNSATNFWVYLVVGVRFRQKCQSIILKGVRRVSFRKSESTDLFPDDTSRDLLTSLGVSGSHGNSIRNPILIPKERERLLSGGGFSRSHHSITSYQTIVCANGVHQKLSQRAGQTSATKVPTCTTSFPNQNHSKRVFFCEERAQSSNPSICSIRRKPAIQMRRSSSAATSSEQMRQFMLSNCVDEITRADRDDSSTYYLNCITDAVA